MPQMSMVKVLQKTFDFEMVTTFLLLDEQHQCLLALSIRRQPESMAATQRVLSAEPLTSDFLAHVLHALGGVLEEITIEALPEKHLFAQLHLRDQRGLHSIHARLDDALPLAGREQGRIWVSEEIITGRAVNLSDYGKTVEESLAEIFRLAEQDPYSLHPPRPAAIQEPLNLDFSHGLQDWHFSQPIEYGSYALDKQTTLMGKVSLAITMHEPITHGSAGILFYGFRALQYRGQRIRLSASVKTEQMHQPELTLSANWSTGKISSLTGTDAGASCLTHSRIVPYDGDSSWARHELVLDIPAEAHFLSFELGTYEQGKLWLAGIECVSVDRRAPLTGTLLRPPPDQPVNLNFSEGLEYWEQKGASSGFYEIAVETTDSPPSATLKSVVQAPAGSCILQQVFLLENYQGKRVRLTANLKTLNVVSHASLFVGSYLVVEDDRAEQVLIGTSDWTTYTLDWQAPRRSMGFIVIGVSLQGTGQLWMRNIQLEAVQA